MTEALRFVPPRVPITDPRTGIISREWYLFLQGVFMRIGGPGGNSTTDLSASLFEDAGSSETNATLFGVEQDAGQRPPPYVPESYADTHTATAHTNETVLGQAPAQCCGNLPDNVLAELSALRDVVSELSRELDSIKQSILT